MNSPQAALRQARALRDVTAAGLLPTLDGSASAQRISTGSGSTKSTANTFLAGLDASWELDVFGGQRSALQAGEASALASAASLGDVRVSVAAEVALDYIALRNAQARLASAPENLASQLETLQITQWRLQAGLVTSLDVEQARTSAEQTAALGGLIGIVLATGASIGLSAVMNLPYAFNPAVNLLSFVFSAAIGVLFGYFPARRAARLNPIDALRHE